MAPSRAPESANKAPEVVARERIALARRMRSAELDLSSLDLTVLPDEIAGLTSLTDLDLMSNRLCSLPEAIGQLPRLTYLNLSLNRLSSLPECIANLKSLTRLRLTGNQLRSLPKAIGELRRLEALYLDANLLAVLPDSMQQMPNLKMLFLHGNDELGLPVEVLGPPWRERRTKELPPPSTILAYYFRMRSGARPLNEAKLILVGRGEVGKTCIVNQLVRGEFADTSKTAGIQITNWQLPGRPSPTQLHVWDFGGQEIMHATHQFFLTERSLYLLVLNGREGGEDYDVEYWLKLINSFGGDSPVLVVLNKINEHPFDLNYRAVQEKYPQVRAFVKTDCRQPTGIDELRTAIADAIRAMPDVKALFPAAWFAIKDRIARMREDLDRNYIAYDRYQELCNDLGETDRAAQDDLAGYLHCLGIALNYRDDPRLRETSLLNPHWVTNGIYRLLNGRNLVSSKGELSMADVSKLLPADEYPVEKHAFIVELMRKFRLCFAFQDEPHHRYLVPELLDKQEPNLGNEFSPRRCLNFEYSYGILPEGLLPGFIVRSNVLSEGQLRWRSGVVLEWNGCRALVKADLAERRISISVQGGTDVGRRELLAVIRSDFERIHREISALEVTSFVPVPDHPTVKIEYDKLLAFEHEGYDEHREIIDGRVVTLSVKQLLSGVDLALPSSRRDTGTGKDDPIRLFISYSHRDEPSRERLEVHLKLLERQEKLAPWNDRKLSPGDEWGERIDRNLEAADIIILLVSADFMASRYCYEVEGRRALERHRAGDAVVIPVIVNDCDWRTAPFGGLAALPKDGIPVFLWGNPESAWADVARGLRRAVEELIERRAQR